MAYFTDTHHRDAGLIEWVTNALSHWLAEVAESMARRRIVRQTYLELSALDDRELHDLGFGRGDLLRIAQEASETD